MPVVREGEWIKGRVSVALEEPRGFVRLDEARADAPDHEHQVAFLRRQNRFVPVDQPQLLVDIDHDVPGVEVGVTEDAGESKLLDESAKLICALDQPQDLVAMSGPERR